MTEKVTNPENDEGETPLAGERLGIARRDRDISLRDIAKELHIDEPKVQDLEQNRFDSLGAPVFAKGHLRKYAEIVGIDPAEVASDYDRLTSSESEPPIVGMPRETPRDIDLTRYIVPVTVVLLVILAVILWVRAGSPLPSFNSEDDSQNALIEIERPVAADSQPANLPEDTSPEAIDPDPGTVSEITPAPDSSDDATEATSVEPEAEVAVTPPSGPEVFLELVFTGDCWTEITDADGERLFFDLGSEGRRVAVSGIAPLRVLFGSYANVSLAVNGNDYPIPASARRGETARFTINAP